MNLSAIFIRRPITTTLIMLGIIVFGLMAYQQLPVSDLPTVDFPTIQVQAGLPGANPETMAAAVATPLEKQFSSLPGIDSISSSSSVGNTNITLQFALDRNIDAAAQDVQTAIARAPGRCRRRCGAPSYKKVKPGDQRCCSGAAVGNAAAAGSQRVRRVDHRAGISMVSGAVRQVQVFARPSTRCGRPRPRSSRARIGVGRWSQGDPDSNVSSRPARCRLAADLHGAGNGQLLRAENTAR